MADLAGVFSIVSRASSLALELYKLATRAPSALNSINTITKSVSNVSSAVKQVGTIIREDDSLPSHKATEALDDVLHQCNSLLDEIESIFPIQSARSNAEDRGYQHSSLQGFRLDSTDIARVDYLKAHLDAIRLTLSVMLQSMYTTQIIMWTKTRPTISPQQAASAIAIEKTQLEALIIEQQMSILMASKLYHPSRSDARLLMENDSSKSLISIEKMGTNTKPADLFKFQERNIASMDASDTTEDDWLPAICGSAKPYLERLLDRWTRLRQLRERLNDDERRVETERRGTLQPTVESDSEDEVGALPKFGSKDARLTTPTHRHPGSVQPLFTDTATLFIPIPAPGSRYGPTAPLSPASSYGVSPRSSGNVLPFGNAPGYSPVSPRSSISTLPVEAAAAIEAKEDDDDVDLKIPWTICVRQDYWDFIDNKIVKASTNLPPPNPLSDRSGCTEILASWVCKEAIKEAGLGYTKAPDDRHDGRRTKLGTCFAVQRLLSFTQVQRLVERTVEIYRKTKPPSPAPPQRRTSSDQPQSSPSAQSPLDRDRTPLASQNQRQPLRTSTYPPPDRSSSIAYQPPPHPSLDRSMSMPATAPNYALPPPQNMHTTNAHLPIPPGHYPPHPGSFSPNTAPYSPTYFPPPVAPFFPPPPTDSRRSSNNVSFPPGPLPPPQPSRRSSKSKSKQDTGDRYSSASTTSDEEYMAARRKEKAKNKKPSSSKKNLAKVVGLAALFDVIVESGVL